MKSIHDDTKRNLERAITTSDVIKIFQEFEKQHGVLKVGTSGHFGEFYDIDNFNFGVKFTDDYSTARWVEITTPDIGDEPD